MHSLSPQTFLLTGPSVTETLIRAVETVNKSLRQFLLTTRDKGMFNIKRYAIGVSDSLKIRART